MPVNDLRSWARALLDPLFSADGGRGPTPTVIGWGARLAVTVILGG